jgi:hypothetical protein
MLRRIMKTVAALCAITLFNATAAIAQKVPRVSLGWGVDTTAGAWADHAWQRDAVEIVRLWKQYLLNDAGSYRPTNAWSAAEQKMWPVYDLTTGTAYQGFPATILDVRPNVQDTSEFVIRTLFASATGDAADVRPIALTTVYAQRENGRWVLSNALPRRTRDWQRATVGRFTFLAEGRPVDEVRARRTLAFADSIANMFAVPPLERLTYYVARTPESVFRAMGIEWTFGALGQGQAITGNGMVMNGSVAFGEENRHEVTHMVLAHIVAEGKTHGLIAEGIPNYFGGSGSLRYPDLVAHYATYLAANPHITLDAVLAQGSIDVGWNPAGAVIVDLVYRAGGVNALQQLLRSGRSHDELKATVTRLLGITWPEVERRWKAHIIK